VYVNGALTSKTFTPPAGSVSNSHVAASADIDATKLEHQHVRSYAQEGSTLAATERRVLHVVRGATGTVVEFLATLRVAAIGDSTVTVNLLKNGTTILTANISLDSGDAAYSISSAAGYTSTSLVQGDVLEVSITATAGTGTLPKGITAELVVREDAQ
jgi:hypothetical protein